jgi:hypothetical protein
MKTKLKLHLLFLALLSLTGFAHAQGTAIGYQGRLNDGSLPATGLYDFTFNVFDVDADGAALAGAVALDAVPVTNGLFNVSLDFGPDVFTGPARWLEITVRTNGVGDPIILSPRTPLLPTPYAIFAGKAGGMASGTVTADQLNSGGIPPVPGQYLSYDGENLLWSDPAVLVGNVWSRNGVGDAYYNSGKVGIGTMGPLTSLEVNGIVRSTRSGVAPQYIQLNGGDSGSIKLTAQSTPAAEKNLFIQNLSGEATAGANNNIQFELGTTAAPSTKMTINRNGNVGIGTVSPPNPLTVHTPNGGNGIEHTDGNIRLATYLGGATGGAWLGTISNHRLNFFVNNGEPSLTILPNGKVGIGDRLPANPLTVSTVGGSHGIEHAGGGVRLATYVGGSTGGGWLGTISNHRLNFFVNNGEPSLTIHPDGNVEITRDASVRTLTIRGGADVAEPFQMSSQNIPKGAVVVIDSKNPGHLKLSDSAYDKRVAGIVSGANGINPGIALHQEGVLDGGENVALSGRVYVQAETTHNSIEPGDLLTTSDTPGYAMKVTEHAKAQGAILGKAMSGLKEGKGMVLVLVTLQ